MPAHALESAIQPKVLDQTGWRDGLARLALAWLMILALFWRDMADMATITWNSSTYNHILLVPPILAWLVSLRLQQLARIAPQIWVGGLALVGAGAMLWLLGSAAGLSVARHLALLLMLQGAVVSMLGYRVARGLMFPLAYAFFLVPIGEEIVPQLQTVTAQMSMALLGWSGIPAHLDGIFISTPTGYFRVAEACSGIEFLVAMIALGALAANVCFKNWWRRAAFMAVCVVVPVLANGVRAWGTMFIAHHSSNDFAAGFDHVFYGWIFFALVLIIVMALGWRFFDKTLDDEQIDGAAIAALPVPFTDASHRAVIAAMAALILLPVVWGMALSPRAAPLPASIALPQVSGWDILPYRPRHDWQPVQRGANHELLGRYRNAEGAEVDLYIALYDGQHEGREMIAWGQGAHDPESQWSWIASGLPLGGGKAETLTAPGPVVREAVTFYRYGDVLTGAALPIKLETMRARLLGIAQPATVIIVSAEHSRNAPARAAIAAFLRDLGPIDKAADRLTSVR